MITSFKFEADEFALLQARCDYENAQFGTSLTPDTLMANQTAQVQADYLKALREWASQSDEQRIVAAIKDPAKLEQAKAALGL